MVHDVVEALHQGHPHAHHHDRASERRIKMCHLLIFLLLYKPPAQSRIHAKTLNATLNQHMAHWISGNRTQPISEYGADDVRKNNVMATVTNQKMRESLSMYL
eukprot:15140004-Ditylum_brightwellii.AAC.1